MNNLFKMQFVGIMILFMQTLPCLAETPDIDSLKKAYESTVKKLKNKLQFLQYRHLINVSTDDKEFRKLVEQYKSIDTVMAAVRRELTEKLKKSPEYSAGQAALNKLQQTLKQTDKTDKDAFDKAQAAVNEQRKRCEELKNKFFADDTAKLQKMGRELSQLRRIMFEKVFTVQADEETRRLTEEINNLEKQKMRQYKELITAEGKILPKDWLAQLPKPNFRKDHTLPKLTRYGWVLPYDILKPLAEDFGYAIQLGGYFSQKSIDQLNDPSSDLSKKVALYKSNPKHHRIAVICDRYFPKNPPPETWSRDADGKLLNSKAQSYDGTEWNPGMKTTISPLAPDSLWQECGEGRAAPFRELRKLVPVSIILNGGEFGLGVWGFAGKIWMKDPKAAKAIADHSGDWFDYISERKAHAENLIADPVKKALPDRDMYIYYTTSGGLHRDRWPGWKAWGFDFKYMRTVGDYPSAENYVNHFNSGFTGKMDLLSLALNAVGTQLKYGDKLAYSWFWAKSDKTDMATYRGFLKMIYMLGTIGGNAGSYNHVDFSEPFKPDSPPAWLKQMVALARVHALFSNLEDDLRNSDLLPGPYKHNYSVSNPAYELVPKELTDATQKKKGQTVLKMGRPVRVLARKYKDKDRWLIGTWSADGKDRTVTVDIPDAGEVSLQARSAGSIYLITKADSKLNVKLCDPDPNYPSAGFSSSR